MEGNVKRKYMENFFSYYWYLSVFVSCVYMLFAVIYKFLPLSVFVSVSLFKFPVAIISNMLITSNLLYCLAFCSVCINDISYIMG